MSLLERQSLRR